MKKKYLFSLFVLGPLLACVWLSLLVVYLYLRPFAGPAQDFVIKSGESFSSINHRLSEKQIVSSPRVFHKLVQWRGAMRTFKPGTYHITEGMAMSDLVDLFNEGVRVFVKVTIPEGKNMFEIAQILEQRGLAPQKDFLLAARDRAFLSSIGIKAPRVEGHLYPDTYQFEPHMSVREMIRMMNRNFKNKIAQLDLSQTKFTLHELVTLASVVEKETGAAHERPIIAGVFINRLNKKMRLQSDPTTIYGIFERFDGNLKKKHLLEKTPYNTYKIPALPIGPIANPGLSAMRAVLNPAKHKYLYFVSKNDGTHVFTIRYKDHLKAVNNWQKNRANRQGRSWRDLKKSQKSQKSRK